MMAEFTSAVSDPKDRCFEHTEDRAAPGDNPVDKARVHCGLALVGVGLNRVGLIPAPLIRRGRPSL